ncbi:MAG: enoyl-CoA hydratase/isomerase family protein [Trebonia sp.]|jgi:enoyl-CoA hydratase/carnithine racemase
MTVTAEPLARNVVLLRVPDPAALDRRDAGAGQQLRDALLQAADDNEVKVIVLAGLAGGAGDTVPPARADPAARLCYTGVRGLHQVTAYCKKVVIAEADGACGPTASALCLAADFVVASARSTFASPFEVDEANYPLAVLTMRANRAKAWMLRGGTIDAAGALEADFVNQVVGAPDLRGTVTDLARRVAVMPLDGVTISKMNVGAAFDVVGVGREFDAVEADLAAGGRQW